MTELENLFFAKAKEVEARKESLKASQDQLAELMTQIGTGTYLQDPSTKVVYKIVDPDGTFVSFKKIDYKRTALEGERGGNLLAKSEAMGMGYVLK